MDYKVIWDEEAIGELGQAVRYIAAKNSVAAQRTGETIIRKAGLLGSFPRLGNVFSKLNRDDVREIPVPPYRIIYQIKDAERLVRILKIWHGARREPDIR
jgi:plasmid stabilization system protein ParE